MTADYDTSVEALESALAEPPPEPKAVTSLRERLDQIVKSTEEYKEKNYKKIPAAKVIRDNELLLFMVQVLSSTNMELHEQIAALRPKPPEAGQLIGVDGRVLQHDEPLMIGGSV